MLAGNISDDDLIDLPNGTKLNVNAVNKLKVKTVEPTTDDLAELDNLM